MYAGFWRRFIAYILDLIVIFIIRLAFLYGIGLLFETLLNRITITPNIEKGFSVIILIIYIPLVWLYFILMESSNLKATVGKMAVGIIVVDSNNNKISFLRATARYFSKILSGILLFIGYIMAGCTKKKQALHDLITSTYVVIKY